MLSVAGSDRGEKAEMARRGSRGCHPRRPACGERPSAAAAGRAAAAGAAAAG